MIGKLYTFRRCPYAIRARLVLKLAGLEYEAIEVDLRNKPKDLFKYSSKGTVPVLVLNSGHVIDESLEIIDWVVENSGLESKKSEMGEAFLIQLTEIFIPALNRYKYASRYKDVDIEKEEQIILAYLGKLESVIQSLGIKYEISIFPFIRQANIANSNWLLLPIQQSLSKWFNDWLRDISVIEIMKK